MADEHEVSLAEDDEADLQVALAEREVRARVEKILTAFHGKQIAITDAGRENMRTVNRLAKFIPLRLVKTDKTFRHNISRYHSDSLDQDILIGARREGNGIWSLVAELAPRDA
jgi:hypothetical protein